MPAGYEDKNAGQECPAHNSSSNNKKPRDKVPFRGLDFFKQIDIHQRNLPHWEQEGACYFVTFRLGDSLPQHLVDQLREERDLWRMRNPEPLSAEQKEEYVKTFTAREQQWLDAGYGACHLRNADIRSLVETSILKFDGLRYDVDCFVLMPNHIHLIWQMREEHRLTQELQALKGASARNCNLMLARQGTFWMDESHDRSVRDAVELSVFRNYIAENPTKAGLKEGDYLLRVFDRLESS